MIDDPDRCYAAIAGRDARFDGWFVFGVTSTGIYCRPSCPARTPRRANARFFPAPAAAQAAGYRACRRCRPDASPGSPAWNLRADLAARAMRLIADGIVDRHGVQGLADRLGYSVRHVHRMLVAEVGVGPQAIARAQRAATARLLIESTSLPFTDVAFAAGFASIRQFNATIGEVFAASPSALRASSRGTGAARDGSGAGVRVRLGYRTPACHDATLATLAADAVPGVDEIVPGRGYRRSLALPFGGATVELIAEPGELRAELWLDDLRDLTAAVQRCRRLLDLDADPVAVDARLGTDARLARAVAARPGLRVPGSVDPTESAMRVLLARQLGQPVARRIATCLATCHGDRLEVPRGGVTRTWPSAAVLADADLEACGLVAGPARAVRALSCALAELQLDVGTERTRVRAVLDRVTGLDPSSVEWILVRALHDPDAFPAADAHVRSGAARLGLPDDPVRLAAHAERWRPWRAVASQHLLVIAAVGRAEAA